MKTIKLILTTLLFLASFAAEAQNVVIYKDGNIVREYTAEQVDSVVYVPAKEVKYYYYVGTEKPTTDSDIEAANMISEEPITTFIGVGDSSQYCWFACPKVWGIPSICTDSEYVFESFSNKDATITDGSLINYSIYRSAAKNYGGTKLFIKWE